MKQVLLIVLLISSTKVFALDDAVQDYIIGQVDAQTRTLYDQLSKTLTDSKDKMQQEIEAVSAQIRKLNSQYSHSISQGSLGIVPH